MPTDKVAVAEPEAISMEQVDAALQAAIQAELADIDGGAPDTTFEEEIDGGTP